MTEPARSRNWRVGLAAVFFVARFAFLAWRATLWAEWEAIDARSTFGPGLTRGAPVGEPCQLTLGSDSDPGSAPSACATSAAVDGGWAVAGKCTVSVVGLEVGCHGLSGGFEERVQVCVAEVFRWRPGIDAPLPQRLAAVDVADSRGEALVEKEIADGGVVLAPRASDDLLRAPRRGEDVRAEVADLSLFVFDEVDHRGVEADRGRVLCLQQRSCLPGGAAPWLVWFVDVPGALPAHVGGDGEAVVEADKEVLADGLDVGDDRAGEALDQVRPGGGDALALQRISQRLRRAPDRVALGHRSADREGDLFFHQIGDGRAGDLGERFTAVALEDPHVLVELGARVVDVGRHALAEGTVLVVIVLPELADDGERGTEELVHALVHDLPALWRCVDQAVEEVDAVADVAALVPCRVSDSLEQTRELAVGLEGLAEAVVAGLGEHALDDHVVGHAGADLRLG